MSTTAFRRLTLATAGLLLASIAAAAPSAPDAVDGRVQQLYASAEYEQALALLGTSDQPEAQLYRALCLLALGRQNETSVVIKSLVQTAPEFTASAEEVPPRFISMLNEARQELVPGILRSMFAEARVQYQQKAYDKAVVQFEKLLALSSAADVSGLDGVADLRVLSEGFIDLARAAQPAPALAAAPVPVAEPVRTPNVPVMKPPTATKQELPPWPATILNGIKNNGAVRVQINESGRVTGATMERSINALYDVRLLDATRFWEYEPATRNGVPVPSESVVEVRVAR